MHEPLTRETWDSRSLLTEPRLMEALRAAGLPLSDSSSENEEESGASAIVCIAEIQENLVNAIIVTPTGIAYRLEPEGFEDHFWRFAAQNYYVVTGNLADRAKLAELTAVELKSIKGRAIERAKGDVPSGLGLDEILRILGYDENAPRARQAQLL